MSKSSILDTTVKTYLIESFDFSGYKSTPETLDLALEFINNEFKTTQNWNIKKLGIILALEEWLRGLPSLLNIAISNHDIIQLAVEWGSLPEVYTEKQADKITVNYWRFMANKLSQLFHGYRVPKEIN